MRRPTLSPTEIQILTSLGDRLRAAPAKAGHRGDLIRNAAALLGCSDKTIYKKLRLVIGDLGRSTRSDKGKTKVPTAELELFTAAKMGMTNDKGQGPPNRVVLAMLRADGKITTQAHPSTIGRQLRAKQLHPDQLTRPPPAKRLSSNHPNHVWQVDSTTASLYYVPNLGVKFIDEAEFNKNKLPGVVKLAPDLLTRWSMVDHTTGAMKVRYQAGGESTENLLTFLVWAMEKQDGCPMHGVPFILNTDQGPANKSGAAVAFCERLDIKFIRHRPRNARATGAVEKSHHLAQMHLEPRLKLMDPSEFTIDLLNEHVTRWCNGYCSHEIHQRHGRTRYAAWMEIKPEELRAPAPGMLRDAAVGKVESCRVDNTLRISFRARSYLLERVPGVEPADKAQVRPNYFRFPIIDVRAVDAETGEETWHQVAPEELNEWGFDGRHVIGEGYESLPDTVRDRSRKRMLREAYRDNGSSPGLPSLEDAERLRRQHAPAFLGRIDPMADVNAIEVPAYLPRRSTPLAVPERRVEPVRLSVVEAAKRVRDRMGPAYDPKMFAEIRTLWPDGVPDDQVGALCEHLVNARDNSAAVGLRRIVGGDL